MTLVTTAAPPRTQSYGQTGLTLIDRFGVYLSKRAILRRLPGRDSLSALDLGCGYQATLLRALAPHLDQGVGIDVRIAPKVKECEKLTFHESTIEDVLPDLKAGRFDLVLLISVLEHLWKPVPVLEQCLRVLRPGGMLFVNVPTWRGKRFLEFSAFRLGTSPAVEMDDHKMYYDVRDLWPLLVRAGFKPSQIKLTYYKFGLNLFATARKDTTGTEALP
jgi:SAM-dependent methyltransferase